MADAATTSQLANITIRRGTPADADPISQAHYEALDQFHAFYGAFFKTHPRDLIPKMTARAFPKEGPSPNVFYVAEEAAGDVVGFVRYSIEEAKEEGVKETEEGKEKEESPYGCKEELKGVWKEFTDAQAERDTMLENAAQGRRHMCKFCCPKPQNWGTRPPRKKYTRRRERS